MSFQPALVRIVQSCIGAKTFYDHVNSRAPPILSENKLNSPYSLQCTRGFNSQDHFSRHRQGAAHFKLAPILNHIHQNQFPRPC